MASPAFCMPPHLMPPSWFFHGSHRFEQSLYPLMFAYLTACCIRAFHLRVPVCQATILRAFSSSARTTCNKKKARDDLGRATPVFLVIRAHVLTILQRIRLGTFNVNGKLPTQDLGAWGDSSISVALSKRNTINLRNPSPPLTRNQPRTGTHPSVSFERRHPLFFL